MNISLFTGKQKKGLELSINFLVVIILSIVMLSLGIYLVRTFFAQSQELTTEIDDATRNRINELLSFGEITALPFNIKEVKAGERGIFGLGVLNVKPQPTTLQIKVIPVGGFDPLNQPIQADLTTWVKYDPNAFTLQPQEQKENPILIRVPPNAVKGTYIFNTCACEGSCTTCSAANRYGSIQKIRVTIP